MNRYTCTIAMDPEKSREKSVFYRTIKNCFGGGGIPSMFHPPTFLHQCNAHGLSPA